MLDPCLVHIVQIEIIDIPTFRVLVILHSSKIRCICDTAVLSLEHSIVSEKPHIRHRSSSQLGVVENHDQKVNIPIDSYNLNVDNVTNETDLHLFVWSSRYFTKLYLCVCNAYVMQFVLHSHTTVQQMCSKIWPNRRFNDKSAKLPKM